MKNDGTSRVIKNILDFLHYYFVALVLINFPGLIYDNDSVCRIFLQHICDVIIRVGEEDEVSLGWVGE